MHNIETNRIRLCWFISHSTNLNSFIFWSMLGRTSKDLIAYPFTKSQPANQSNIFELVDYKRISEEFKKLLLLIPGAMTNYKLVSFQAGQIKLQCTSTWSSLIKVEVQKCEIVASLFRSSSNINQACNGQHAQIYTFHKYQNYTAFSTSISYCVMDVLILARHKVSHPIFFPPLSLKYEMEWGDWHLVNIFTCSDTFAQLNVHWSPCQH